MHGQKCSKGGLWPSVDPSDHEKSTTEICIAGQATIQKSFSFA
jgi:hypothetical protein